MSSIRARQDRVERVVSEPYLAAVRAACEAAFVFNRHVHAECGKEDVCVCLDAEQRVSAIVAAYGEDARKVAKDYQEGQASVAMPVGDFPRRVRLLAELGRRIMGNAHKDVCKPSACECPTDEQMKTAVLANYSEPQKSQVAAAIDKWMKGKPWRI